MAVDGYELAASLSTAASELGRWQQLIRVWELGEASSAKSGGGLHGVILDEGFMDQIEVLIRGSRLYKGAQ